MEEYILTFIAALIGSVLGSVGTALTLRFQHKQLYAETVSKNRMDWINIWRESIAEFLACAETICEAEKCSSKGDCNFLCEARKRMYKARGMITSRGKSRFSNTVNS